MVRTSRSWLFGFSLLATLTLSGQPLAWALKSRLIAQAPSTFTLPESVPDGTTIRIDGSSSMEVINQSLEAQFEERYDGTTVELLANGSDAALQSLLDGDIELAAIGRPLTADEKAQGLREALISREKIAIVVGPDSPFDENLTFEQFAQIFRGEITDWSELGGEPGEIRFVDRPESSDTRAAFQNYPVFQAAPFETGATADPVDADETRAVIEALGDDGVGYAIASQVLDNDAVKIVPMHKTLPDDPRYPFSQPRGYVYLGEPSPAVQAFLGFATSPDGQAAVAEAKETEAVEAGGTAPIEGLTALSPDGEITARVTDLGQIILEDAGGAEISALAGITGSIAALKFSPDSQSLALATEDGTVQVWGIDGRPLGDPFTVDVPTPLDFQFTNDNKGIAFTGAEGPQLFDFQGNPLAAAGRRIPFWWWLLPLALLGLLMWALLRGREQEQSAATAAATPPEPDIAPPGNASAEMPEVATVTPPDLGPDPAVLDGAEPQLSSRAHTVINEDREHPFSFTGADAGLAAGLTGGLAAGAMALGRETPDEPDTPGLSLDDVPEADALPLVEVGADTSLQPTADASVPAMPEPSIVEPPVVEPPVVESPVTEPPGGVPLVVEPPLAAAPVADEPVADEPVVEEPVADEPGVEEPVANEANVEEPAIAETSDLDWGAAAIAGGTVLGATAAAAQLNPDRRPMPEDLSDEQSAVEAAKYDAGAEALDMETLATVDEGLSDLPDGYGESRIVLMPRDPQWAYTYWDVPGEHREEVRRQGGRQLALRLYDVTDVDLEHQAPHSLQQYDCDEMARSWYLPIPVSDRDYVVEIGYLAGDGDWLMLARSAPAHIPPVYPSDWIDDRFLTIDWNEDLKGKTFATLKRPVVAAKVGDYPIHDAIFDQAQGTEAMRVAGSLFGSMQQVPEQAVSSFVFPSGMGVLPTVSGMSGVGFSASAPPIRPRKFWLVADAELIVYGATEPDATLTVGDRVIELNPDGTFRFHMSFQDGMIDYPIQAVAADGEQTRSVHMEFERETSNRNTNTKEDATEDWFDEWF